MVNHRSLLDSIFYFPYIDSFVFFLFFFIGTIESEKHWQFKNKYKFLTKIEKDLKILNVFVLSPIYPP